MLLATLNLFEVIQIVRDKLILALQNESFKDFEDCLQMECAKDFSADYIVTRNIKDFANSSIKPILPSDFLKLVSK